MYYSTTDQVIYFDHLENTELTLHDLKRYLLKEKNDFLKTLIPLPSKEDTVRHYKIVKPREYAVKLYEDAKEDHDSFMMEIHEREREILNEEHHRKAELYESIQYNHKMMKFRQYLKKHHNLLRKSKDIYYEFDYDIKDLISLEEKKARLGAKISKHLFSGHSLEYIVTDNNINECDYFQEISMRRYWFFRFSLFHKLKYYLKNDETDFKKDALNKLSASETNDPNLEKPEDLEEKEKQAYSSSEDNTSESIEWNMGVTIIEHPDIKETVPEEDKKYYTLSDDDILKENEQALQRNLDKFKSNNIVKATILEDFKPILLSRELWFSVSPEDIAAFMSEYSYKKLSDNGKTKLKGISMDITSGSGMDAMHLSKYWDNVIAVDISLENLYCSFKNAQNYGVLDKISYINNDFNDPVFLQTFKEIYKDKVDFIYSSPPWLGPTYSELMSYDVDNHLGMDGLSNLLNKCLMLTENCCFLLPKNSSIDQLISIARFHYKKIDPPIKVIYVSLDGKTKGLLAFFGEKLCSA
ncbi:uncharacterized protein HGUI_02887 [Hanseniaspora guilliermondii]|uniref:Trimethylguanosine synthase n=1 Tax=Hanseniaspora guilliermondii TaxID=56406 RepID=A0A1L0D0N3_9ASCO|nr:uncharacterized protein HGUI_02887 [Hanseniaspora guilliermondii]